MKRDDEPQAQDDKVEAPKQTYTKPEATEHEPLEPAFTNTEIT